MNLLTWNIYAAGEVLLGEYADFVALIEKLLPAFRYFRNQVSPVTI